MCAGLTAVWIGLKYLAVIFVQVSDFGLSTLFKPGQGSALAAQHGALAYMPPELLSADTLSYATDVYSFGVLLWEMLTAQVRK